MNFIRKYGPWGFLRLCKEVITAKIIFGLNGRRMMSPFRIFGKRYISVGKGFNSGRYFRVEVFEAGMKKRPTLQFGENVKINDFVHIGCIEKIVIKDNVLIGSHVLITDHNHGDSSGEGDSLSSPDVPPDLRPLTSEEVVIEENVWIGEFVSILPGTRIGKGSIIGTMSVVKGPVPPYSIAVGTPVRVVKTFNFSKNRWEATKRRY